MAKKFKKDCFLAKIKFLSFVFQIKIVFLID